MIKREQYMSKIRPFIGMEIVKVLSGIRRCGKSVMLELIQEELKEQGVLEQQMLSINFESKKFENIDSLEGTYDIIKEFAFKSKNKKIYIFLDEIQELDGWERIINSSMIDFNIDIYITGSNAKLLSGELATYLAGRYVEFKIYPFSFKEVLEIMPDLMPSEAFQIFLTRGGMPFIYQFPIDDKSSMQYLSDIYDSIILKDIATRNKIRDIELLKRIIQFFMGNIGNAFSAKNITKYLKSDHRGVSTETIYNYIEYCKSACFLHLVPREDIIGKRILQFQEKIYIADHGIREAVYGNNLKDINQVLENIVFMELLSRGYNVAIGKKNNLEIDFVATIGNEKIYVQVAYILALDETIEREFSVLENINDNYPKYVVTMDEINRSRSGIRHVNIRDFLTLETY